MRIHELIEACVEYVAIDGVIGTESEALLQHVRTLDASIDEGFFSHIFKLLVEHPAIQIILTTHPLPSPDIPLELGTAPLPEDYVDPAEVAEEAVAPGKRGRALAFHHEGKEYLTDKEAMEAKREAKRQKASQPRDHVKIHQDVQLDGTLLRFLGDDDGDEGDERVEIRDYSALRKKWGTRLRIRATDDEIYYRLTGSHAKLGKLTATVFYILQLTARSRQKGVSAIELGPATGQTQGSMHYFMKVLCEMGLCAKVPIVTHSSITNLLIYHQYLEQNPHYRASMRMPPLEDELEAKTDAPPANLPAGNSADPGDEDDEEDDGTLTRPSSDWNLNFTSITEEELMAGHVVKDRLLRLLDHPDLRNHLLKRLNLLILIGWQHDSVLRHRRAVNRHVDALIHDGVVEVVEVGDRHTRCLRLTKYNPNYVAPNAKRVDEVDQFQGLSAMDDISLVDANTEAYHHFSPVSLTLSIDYHISNSIASKGSIGSSIADLRYMCDFYFKRNIENHLVRSESAWTPPHLRSHHLCQIMDSFGRERHLRAFTLPYFGAWAVAHGAEVAASHPPLTDEIGHWGTLEHRDLWESPDEVKWGGLHLPRFVSSNPNMRPKPRGRGPAKNGKTATSGKERKYESEVQSRGRPRMYIHVVNEDGKVNRHVVGSLLPHPDLSPIYIYVKEQGMLVPGPIGWDGLGAPPAVTPEDMKNALPVSSFSKYKRKGPKGPKKGSKKGPKKGKSAEIELISDDDETEAPPVQEATIDAGAQASSASKPAEPIPTPIPITKAPMQPTSNQAPSTFRKTPKGKKAKAAEAAASSRKRTPAKAAVETPAKSKRRGGSTSAHVLDTSAPGTAIPAPTAISAPSASPMPTQPTPIAAEENAHSLSVMNTAPAPAPVIAAKPAAPIDDSVTDIPTNTSPNPATVTDNAMDTSLVDESIPDVVGPNVPASTTLEQMTSPTLEGASSPTLEGASSPPLEVKSPSTIARELTDPLDPAADPMIEQLDTGFDQEEHTGHEDVLAEDMSRDVAALTAALADRGDAVEEDANEPISGDSVPANDAIAQRPALSGLASSSSPTTETPTTPTVPSTSASSAPLQQQIKHAHAQSSQPAPSTPAVSSSGSASAARKSTKSSPKPIGRRPKYTAEERGFPTVWTPVAPPAVERNADTPKVKPIVDGQYNSSVLLPKATRKRVRSASVMSTPATPGPQSASPPADESTPLFASSSKAMKSRKRKASLLAESSTAETPTAAPAQKAKRAKRPSAAAESSMPEIVAPDIEQEGLEVPVEWLQLREKVRQDQLAEEAEQARLAAEKEAQAAALAEEKARKGAAREARASQRARDEEEQKNRLALLLAQREEAKKKEEEEKQRKKEERARRAEEKAKRDAEKKREDEEKARKHAEEMARLDAEKRREDAERARIAAEEKRKLEEEQKRQEEEERRRVEEEERARRVAEEQAKQEEKRKKEEEERRKQEADKIAREQELAKQDAAKRKEREQQLAALVETSAPRSKPNAAASTPEATDLQQDSGIDFGLDAGIAPSSPVSRRFGTPSVAPSSPAPGTPFSEMGPGLTPGPAATYNPRMTKTRGAIKHDFGHVKRVNELLQALRDAGDVLETHQFLKEIRDWHKRWEGTDHPFAPAKATQMDRSTFMRIIGSLVDEGKLKTTQATCPTLTGQIKQVKVFWLADASQETVNAYIRGLGQMMNAVYGPKARAASKIAATEFTEVRVSGTPTVKSKRSQLRPSIGGGSPHPLSQASAVTAEQRRSILLQDAHVVPYLYGYEAGRNARVGAMHTALIEVFDRRPDAGGIIGSSPWIFGLELLFTEISVSRWFSAVSWNRYTEELADFVQDPATTDLPLKAIPASLQPPSGFGGFSTKTKILSLLEAMAELKLVVPLDISTAEDGEIESKDQAGTSTWFKRANSVAEAMFFRVYEAAPLYHIAADAIGLLGVMPLQTVAEAESYWEVMREVSMVKDVNSLPAMERQTDHSRHAPLTNQLTFKNPECLRNLRIKRKWRAGYRMLAEQIAAVEDVVDPKTGEVTIDDAAIGALAWEWCLPKSLVEETISKKVERVTRVAERRRVREEKEQAIVEASRKRAKVETDLKAKIQEMKAANKVEWEKRVQAAAERTGAEYSTELLEFMARHVLYARKYTFAAASKGPLKDQVLDDGCLAFIRRKAQGPDVVKKTAMVTKAPLKRRTKKAQKAKKPKVPRDPTKPVKRNRRAWSAADDEMLLEGQAIIQARYKDRNGVKPSRMALVQLFENVSMQVSYGRLKKIWARPGMQTYYDRLIDTYYELWVRHRGSADLPDEHIDSATDFDLKKHLEFLRTHIDRAELRESSMQLWEETVHQCEDLPEDFYSLLENKAWDFAEVSQPTMESVWDASAGDDIRSGLVGLVPLTEEKPIHTGGSTLMDTGKFKAVMRMIIGHPAGDYHPDAGKNLCNNVSTETQEEAYTELMDEKVMKKARQPDGRQYQFHPSWVTSGEGPYPPHVFEDAEHVHERFEDGLKEEDSFDWPLMCNPGDMAAMMNMVSNHEVEFDFDHKSIPTLQYWTDTYNTRKLNDVDLEFDLTVRRVKTLPELVKVDAPMIYAAGKPAQWQVDDLADGAVVDSALTFIKASHGYGLTKTELAERLSVDMKTLPPILAALAQRETFWAGYDTARIVHTDHWTEWTIRTRPPIAHEDGRVTGISPDPNSERLVVPRRWVDVYGRLVKEEWEQAKRNVMGWVMSRPGMTERLLRHCIGNSLDRLEVNEVLQNLVDCKMVVRRCMADGQVLPPVEGMDVDDELGVACWPMSEGVLWR